MSETVCVDGATAISRSERPTANLRWFKGMLQQQVEVTTYDRGRIVDGSIEWRDVPIEPPTLSVPAPQGIGREALIDLIDGEPAFMSNVMDENRIWLATILTDRILALLPTEPPAQEPR